MSSHPGPIVDTGTTATRADALFTAMRVRGFRQTDHLFAVILLIEWIAAILVALFFSPLTWDGEVSRIDVYVRAAFYLGGAIITLPVALALARPGATVTRHVVAVGQMLMGALFIHLGGGRIETHFHVFGSLAFLAFYRDWPVLVTASVVVVLDHWLRGLYWPRSIFGVLASSPWRWVEHAGWVVFEDVFLIRACVLSLGEMRDVSGRRAELEDARDAVERKVELRTSELHLMNGELQHEIAERRWVEAELKEAIGAAEAASRAKGEFLANMSHEIRTPMNGILGMTELALETPLNPQQREYLTLAKTSADSLLCILNDILDFSKIEAGKLDISPQPFQLRECVEETLRTLALRAHSKGLELACRIASDVPNTVVGDSGRLRQVLVNLVGNAIKFTERGEVVVASELESGDRDEAVIRFTVSDTGIGIPRAKIETIFEPFEQADSSTTRRYGGTGLGLAISVQLVRMMGGSISLDSALGQGSVFRFTVRLGRGQETSRHRVGGTGMIEGLRFLLVDDNRTNRRILEEILANWGATSVSVDGGRAALQVIHDAESSHRPFDLALIDGMMPEMDGFELAERISGEPRFAGLRMIMLTSAGRAHQTERCRSVGILDCLLKPVSQSELFNAITRILEPEEGSPREVVMPFVSGPPATRLRLLLAEDHLVNQKLAIRMLENLGHRATVVGDGVEALAAMEAEEFEVVLMDIQMPGMDGFEALAALRERERHTGMHVPVFALTAHAMKGDRERCLEAGFDGYLSKPIKAAELRLALSEVGAGPASRGPGIRLTLDRLLETCDGDVAFLNELVGSFMESSPRLLSSIEKALGAGDPQGAAAEAHGWKGISQTIGVEELATLCRRLEEVGRRGELAEARVIFVSIQAAWERIGPAIVDSLQECTSEACSKS
jgi:two-component system sensor histidine kinase/response regulator